MNEHLKSNLWVVPTETCHTDLVISLMKLEGVNLIHFTDRVEVGCQRVIHHRKDVNLDVVGDFEEFITQNNINVIVIGPKEDHKLTQKLFNYVSHSMNENVNKVMVFSPKQVENILKSKPELKEA